MSEDCVWLYAVQPADAASRFTERAGVDGERVRVVGAGELAALVGDVGGGRFGAQALRRNLERLDWLAEVARVHDAVVRRAAEAGSVVPARLATVFENDDAVRRLLVERRPEFAAVLESVRGRAEWGVKAWAKPEAGSRAEPGTDEGARPQVGAGSAYLMQRRAQLAARRDAENEAARWSRAADARLREICAAGRVHRPQDPELTGRPEAMILNASYLVDEARIADLRALVAELDRGRQDVEVELTGPWPPYSFIAAGTRDG